VCQQNTNRHTKKGERKKKLRTSLCSEGERWLSKERGGTANSGHQMRYGPQEGGDSHGHTMGSPCGGRGAGGGHISV